MSNAYIPDQLHQMSKKELLEFAQTAHEENVGLVKRVKELESHNVKLESYNVKLANESHEYQQRCAELEQEVKNGIFEASCFDVDVIQCLNKIAYEHNADDIPRYREKAKRCAQRISKRASDVNKFAIEQKQEAIEEYKKSDEFCRLLDSHFNSGKVYGHNEYYEQLRKEQEK